MSFAHLHTRSWFSFLAGGSSPEALAEAAARNGIPALALTDRAGVYGVVRFARACRERGIRPLFGADVPVEGHSLVLLAATREGYANLCRILTEAHLHDRDTPDVSLETVRSLAGDLFCLTGTDAGRLWKLVDARQAPEAMEWVRQLHAIFGERLSIEVTHQRRPGDALRVRRLHALGRATGVPLLATGDVRYAVPEAYRTYDLLTCIRLGITVFEPHAERPRNAEAYLQPEAELRERIPYPEAFERAAAVAARCDVDLLPGLITPPAARLPEGTDPNVYLWKLARRALDGKYPPGETREKAVAQLIKEMTVLKQLELAEFFLVVREIVHEARCRGIRAAGRGSAANSIVAYLLGITGVDPLQHRLLFERFLHQGRRGTPDIDVDFDSERREEVIAWMEERFGMEQTAMTATLVTYRLRSALRDAAKALGWSMETVNQLSKSVPPRGAKCVRDYRVAMEQVLGPSPLFDVLIDLVEAMHDCPRHLGLHSGGMVLSRQPLYRFTPIQVSANGVKVTQFDKDDTEALGLVKFDVLGLRMLAAVSEAMELVHRYETQDLDVDALSLDDVRTFNLIRAGKTLGVFQIESQGQLHLLAKNQPDTFDDIITEIALFRPGPVQGGMVHPFVKRRRGEEPVTYLHPDLEPVLSDTYGIILFQEQVLEIAHHFAGMSLQEADDFRRLMSKFRDPGEMESMRGRFVEGATGRGVPEPVAQEVFEKVAKFVGYGFCRSHAAAFARTVYQSAYLKCHHPAAYMAAVMQHRPGMYSLMTLEQEARRFGVRTLTPDIHRSAIRYGLEPLADGRLAIRKPLTSVEGLSEEAAKALVWERLQRRFTGVEDLYTRVALDVDVYRNLARSGALDGLAGDSRKALWEVGVLARRLGPAGRQPTPALFQVPAIAPEDLPALESLTLQERLSWDYETHRAARIHPMTLSRRSLTDLEIRPIEMCYRLGRSGALNPSAHPLVTVAGITILRQRPPTAKGVMFLTLEDETGFMQCVVRPHVLEYLDHVLRSSALIVRGQLHIAGNWRGLVVVQAWRLDGIFGGYEGHPCYAGGTDVWVRRPAEPPLALVG